MCEAIAYIPHFSRDVGLNGRSAPAHANLCEAFLQLACENEALPDAMGRLISGPCRLQG
jgi:hypothetical protein